MKRFRVIMLFLVLGASINVAVAWGSAAWIDVWVNISGKHQAQGVSESEFPCWGVVVVWRQSATYVFRSAISKPHTNGVGWFYPRNPPYWSASNYRPTPNEPLDTMTGMVEDGRGWPMISMYSNCEAWFKNKNRPSQGWAYGRVTKGIPLGTTQGVEFMPRALPLGIVWPGFLLNTIAYAFALWFLWFASIGWSRMRQERRRKRGLCPRCAYDLQGATHDTCPECGSKGTRP